MLSLYSNLPDLLTFKSVMLGLSIISGHVVVGVTCVLYVLYNGAIGKKAQQMIDFGIQF